ncbi:MAG: coproporphyrinogen dehydrogenase HemZ [Eubacteriaceae bacterium]|nr:coproporphyrinogen dehydrogenase HemZ [Eubacteriaceae bacterium]
MYKIVLQGVSNNHEYEELIKLFLRPDEYEICGAGDASDADFVFVDQGDKNIVKSEIYDELTQLTGIRPVWGILTGIRPVKLAGELVRDAERHYERDAYAAARRKMVSYYRTSGEKADLALDMYRLQQETFGVPPDKTVGVYIDIPFCPTRCLYCSFASNQTDYSETLRYMEALYREMNFVADGMKEKGWSAESIYIGGGTPSTLEAADFRKFLLKVKDMFGGPQLAEFTVEMGRPDTITAEKLEAVKEAGAQRISINPQTMKDETLELIGRKHDSTAVREAFAEAQNAGIRVINADLIAGLPLETAEDFDNTLKEVRQLGPQNITVHSLSVKRASKLVEIDKDFHYKQAGLVTEMLEQARSYLAGCGYRPYYLYRQKHMSGAQENTGYALPGTEGLYNVRIMDETQTIIAMGASGMTKVYFPEENRLERVPNVSNYEIYIERIDEMINRKKEGLFNAYERT